MCGLWHDKAVSEFNTTNNAMVSREQQPSGSQQDRALAKTLL
jgi:hypothetical protein